MSQHCETNKLLGYPPDARLLIINADDFGMCHAANEAAIHTIKDGLATSCTLMMPCPWSLHGLHLLKESPDISFGIHLTAISEHMHYRWGPLTPLAQVPSLVDEAGYFYSEKRIDEFLWQVSVTELEVEFRAQIEAVLSSGLRPTHLDSHCGIHRRSEDVFEMTMRLACEYGLALRVSLRPRIERLQAQGYPTNDYEILNSYRFETKDKPHRLLQLLQELPPGLSEWAMHPGLGNAEMRAITPSWDIRKADFDFLTSREARNQIEQEGIILLSYKPLQQLWQTRR